MMQKRILIIAIHFETTTPCSPDQRNL